MKFDSLVINRNLNLSGFGLSTVSSDNIQKGDLSEAFRYTDTFKIQKTGKQIKAVLSPMLLSLEKQKKNLKKELESIKNTIGVEPDMKVSNYRYRESKKEFPNGLMQYSYELRNKNNGMYPNTNNYYVMYNEKLEQYLDVCNDLAYGNMLHRNLNEKTTFTLNTRQATALGF